MQETAATRDSVRRGMSAQRSMANAALKSVSKVKKTILFFARHPAMLAMMGQLTLLLLIPMMVASIVLSFVVTRPSYGAIHGGYDTNYLREHGLTARTYSIAYECGLRNSRNEYYDYFGDGRAGAYNFHYAYGLRGFIRFCYEKDSVMCAEFAPYVDATESELRSENAVGAAWHTVYARNPDAFSALQDEFAWDVEPSVNGQSFSSVVEYQANRGLHLDRYDDIVQGLVFSWHNRAGVENCYLSFLESAGITDAMSNEEVINALCDEIETRGMDGISGLSGDETEIRERYCTGGPTVGGPGVAEKEFCLSILNGTGTYGRGKQKIGGNESSSEIGWSATDHSLEEFLAALQTVTDEGARFHWHWGDSSSAVPGDDGVTSCDAIIDRALMKMGFTYRPDGHRIHVMDYPDILPKCGFVKIADPNDRMPGDIVVFKANDGGADHVFAIKAVNDDGTIDKFDHGENARIWLTPASINDHVQFDQWPNRDYYCTLRGNWTAGSDWTLSRGMGPEYISADGTGITLTGGGAQIAYEATKYVGQIPYRWGGSSLETGVDCSHFVWLILKECGAYNGGYLQSFDWVNAGTAVEGGPETAEAGDVLVWDGHVGFADGHGGLIEARGAAFGLTHSRQASEVTKEFLGIRRFHNSSTAMSHISRGTSGYITTNDNLIIELVKLFFGNAFGNGHSGSIAMGGASALGTGGEAMALEAEVKFQTHGTIGGVKVGLHGRNRQTGAANAYALDVIYGPGVETHDHCYLHSEGIWAHAELSGDIGKEYKDIYEHDGDYTDWVHLRVAWWEDGTVRSYVNGQLMFEGASDLEPELFAIEATALGDGEYVQATFRNVHAYCDYGIWQGTSGQWQTSGYMGLSTRMTEAGSVQASGPSNTHGEPAYGVSAILGGRVSGAGGLNWDQTMEVGLPPISCYLTIGKGRR